MSMFNLINISLLEVSFTHEGDMAQNGSEYEAQVRLSRTFEGAQLLVDVTVELSKNVESTSVLKMNVKTRGIFEISGDIDEGMLENFANINGPAIIYPFIRETVASLSSKANISTILLPPLNFVEMAERNRQNSSQISQ